MKQHDDSMQLGKRGYGRIDTTKGYADGEVLTPFGIVSVYAQGDQQNAPHTRLHFVWYGRLHMRSFSGKRYSPRGIVTKAMEFAREIASPNARVDRPDAALCGRSGRTTGCAAGGED